MKLAISNIALSNDNCDHIYEYMKTLNYVGLEIAPTKIIKNSPYNHLNEAKIFADIMNDNYNICIPSIQSIWYGRNENIVNSLEERAALLSYSKEAINFAQSIKCSNLVFGCPKNRNINKIEDIGVMIGFFKEVGDYALKNNTVFALEANPTIYNTNFMNTTMEAIEIVKKVNCKGIKVNLDVGTMIYNRENIDSIKEYIPLVNHVHISEPNLNLIEKREIHKQLSIQLRNYNYNGFVSIEMREQEKLDDIKLVMTYIKEVFS